MAVYTSANNLFIDVARDYWRLRSANPADDAPIADADATGFSYRADFGAARRLPSTGKLTPDQISRVMVGWTDQNNSWHLGILLNPTTAQDRGGLWCSLARWYADDQATAEQAGRGLAAVLHCPFQMVARPAAQPIYPADDVTPIEAPAPTMPSAPIAIEPAVPSTPSLPTIAAPDAELPSVTVHPLPLKFSDWVVEEVQGDVQWSRDKSWKRDAILRGLFLLVMAPVFAYLAIGALQTAHAKVQPEFLPYAGLILTIVMLISALLQFRDLWAAPTSVADQRLGVFRQSWRGGKKVLQAPYEGIEYVLVSHVIERVISTQQPTINQVMMDVWVHVQTKRRGFLEVCYASNVEGEIWKAAIQNFEREPLKLEVINSPVHQAAVHFGEALGVRVLAEKG